jgi:hypothetical protein
MAGDRKVVVSNVLCFTVNKFHYEPQKQLKSLILDFYNGDEIDAAKDLLYKELEVLKIEKLVKVTIKRRESTGKTGMSLVESR